MLTETLNALKHLLWPDRCASCDRLIDQPNIDLCAACHGALQFIGQLPPPPGIAGAFAFFNHDGPIQSMIAKWKYHEDYAAQHALLRCAALHLTSLQPWLPSGVFVPVPPHPKRLQKRGFDPVWTFAKKLTAMLQSLDACIALEDDLLSRVIHTPHQAGRSAEARRDNLRGAFKVNRPCKPAIILIDDVLTTGATAAACAEALALHGAHAVYLLTLTHAHIETDSATPHLHES